MAPQKIVLFDIPDKEHQCWSPNVWKVRMALAYKEIDYTTHWLEFPVIEPFFKERGVPPNEEGTPYTCPALEVDGTIIMGSEEIVEFLEKEHPSPSLHLDDEIVAEVEGLVSKLTKTLVPTFLVYMPEILSPESAEYFTETRGKMVGTDFHTLHEMNSHQAWEAANPIINSLTRLLQGHRGPFFRDETPTYADFILVSFMKWLSIMDQELFRRFTSIVLRRLSASSGQWLRRSD